MKVLYNLGIYLLYLIIYISSFFNSKAKLWIVGRLNIFKKISLYNNEGRKTIWVHCSSLGEFEQGRPIIDKIKSQFSEYKIVLSFFSPSGYEIRKNYQNADFVTYLPLDTQGNAKKFISLIKPDIVYFIKYEHWYNYLKTLYLNKIPVFLVAANFRENQIFFKSYGKWYRNVLNFYTKIFVQEETSVKLLETYNFQNVNISGDTRFDRVYENSLNATDYPKIREFKSNKFLIIAGSTWEKDEEILIEYINNCKRDIKYIIAPHNINEVNINRIEKQLKISNIKYSQLKDSTQTNYQVLIIDNIGMLSSLYQYGDIAYIGGGFNAGIHNTLEAATFGLPVVFGPKYFKFREAIELIEKQLGFSISNYPDFEKITNQLLDNPELRANINLKSKELIQKSSGATLKIINQTLLK
ncbi:MAG: hypothetical protein A2046_02195 [Bacteroidetes bacterium GWA2_30_7]|nr:MAG: hypothetical protein A2046_02195 [Bacteroidetes bacterium GWA2_30_7]